MGPICLYPAVFHSRSIQRNIPNHVTFICQWSVHRINVIVRFLFVCTWCKAWITVLHPMINIRAFIWTHRPLNLLFADFPHSAGATENTSFEVEWPSGALKVAFITAGPTQAPNFICLYFKCIVNMCGGIQQTRQLHHCALNRCAFTPFSDCRKIARKLMHF